MSLKLFTRTAANLFAFAFAGMSSSSSSSAGAGLVEAFRVVRVTIDERFTKSVADSREREPRVVKVNAQGADRFEQIGTQIGAGVKDLLHQWLVQDQEMPQLRDWVNAPDTDDTAADTEEGSKVSKAKV